MDMRKKISSALACLLLCVACAALCGCDNVDECPPVHSGYSSTVILPEATFLTDADREYIDNLENEFETNAK